MLLRIIIITPSIFFLKTARFRAAVYIQNITELHQSICWFDSDLKTKMFSTTFKNALKLYVHMYVVVNSEVAGLAPWYVKSFGEFHPSCPGGISRKVASLPRESTAERFPTKKKKPPIFLRLAFNKFFAIFLRLAFNKFFCQQHLHTTSSL
jgi:hypothetical protein